MQEEVESYRDKDQVAMAQALRDFGFDPCRIKEAVRSPKDMEAFLELHIEQGPILENNHKDVGIVEVVVGIQQIEVTIVGRPDHAGTTPMDMRSDALVAAAQVFLAVQEGAICAGNGTVATVGKLQLLPGSANIVPGMLCFTVDIRSPKSECLTRVVEAIQAKLAEVEKSCGVQTKVQLKLEVPPTNLDQHIMDVLSEKAEQLGLAVQRMRSGAGHDAMVMAGITKVGLIFVPSKGGRSHCPEEWTVYNQLQKGIELEYHTICQLAKV